jgi:hypothetical protein
MYGRKFLTAFAPRFRFTPYTEEFIMGIHRPCSSGGHYAAHPALEDYLCCSPGREKQEGVVPFAHSPRENYDQHTREDARNNTPHVRTGYCTVISSGERGARTIPVTDTLLEPSQAISTFSSYIGKTLCFISRCEKADSVERQPVMAAFGSAMTQV